MIHCRLSVEKCRARCAEGSAMLTIVASSTTISCAVPSSARTAQRLACLSAAGIAVRTVAVDEAVPQREQQDAQLVALIVLEPREELVLGIALCPRGARKVRPPGRCEGDDVSAA